MVNYGVELLLQEGCVRVSNLNSNGLMRTCAVVNFSLPVPVWLQDTIIKFTTVAPSGKQRFFSRDVSDKKIQMVLRRRSIRASQT